MSKQLVGAKFFKKIEDSDDIKLVRVIDQYQVVGNVDMVLIRDLDTNEDIRMEVFELGNQYKQLEADGLLMISEVIADNNHDVLVSAYSMNSIREKKMTPFCVCRQCITDLYYNLLIKEESDMITGMSMNVLNVPQGFNFGYMLLSDKVVTNDTILIYRDDIIEDILNLYRDSLKLDRYDECLRTLYKEHCTAFPEALFLDEHKGWCKSVSKLLSENNFQSDVDQMFGITTVEFEINDYITEVKVNEDSEESYLSITDELRYWLSYLYKLNINRVYVLPFENDIDFDDLKNSRYFIFRDKVKKLYIFVYTIDGEYKEAELEEKDKQLDFSTKFRIHFLDKYRELHKDEF